MIHFTWICGLTLTSFSADAPPIDSVFTNLNYRRQERFAGLHIRGFSTIKVFMEILSCCLAISAHYLVQLKRGAYIHGKTFAVLLKTLKNAKVYLSESFSVYGNHLVF